MLDESLRKVKTLGQADEDVDDLTKWVTKSRTTAEEEKELARLQAAAAALKAEEVAPLHRVCCAIQPKSELSCMLIVDIGAVLFVKGILFHHRCQIDMIKPELCFAMHAHNTREKHSKM